MGTDLEVDLPDVSYETYQFYYKLSNGISDCCAGLFHCYLSELTQCIAFLEVSIFFRVRDHMPINSLVSRKQYSCTNN